MQRIKQPLTHCGSLWRLILEAMFLHFSYQSVVSPDLLSELHAKFWRVLLCHRSQGFYDTAIIHTKDNTYVVVTYEEGYHGTGINN